MTNRIITCVYFYFTVEISPSSLALQLPMLKHGASRDGYAAI